MHLAMCPAAETMELCDMVATRLIPQPSAPRSYTCENSQVESEFSVILISADVPIHVRVTT